MYFLKWQVGGYSPPSPPKSATELIFSHRMGKGSTLFRNLQNVTFLKFLKQCRNSDSNDNLYIYIYARGFKFTFIHILVHIYIVQIKECALINAELDSLLPNKV